MKKRNQDFSGKIFINKLELDVSKPKRVINIWITKKFLPHLTKKFRTASIWLPRYYRQLIDCKIPSEATQWNAILYKFSRIQILELHHHSKLSSIPGGKYLRNFRVPDDFKKVRIIGNLIQPAVTPHTIFQVGL